MANIDRKPAEKPKEDDDDDRPKELPIYKRPPPVGKTASSSRLKNDHLIAKTQPNTCEVEAGGEQTSNFAPRDPRFDSRCSGSNDVRHFRRNYAFLDEVKKREIDELTRALQKEKDAEKRDKIRSTISRMKNKMVESDNKMRKLDVVDRMRSDIRSSKSGVNDSRKKTEGKSGRKQRNVFVKKSDIKKNLMLNKFKELKESGKLSKYMERKRKKLINRDGKSFAG